MVRFLGGISAPETQIETPLCPQGGHKGFPISAHNLYVRVNRLLRYYRLSRLCNKQLILTGDAR